MKNRLWLVVLLFAAGLIIGVAARPAILNYTARYVSFVQAEPPGEAESDNQTLAVGPDPTAISSTPPALASPPANAGDTADPLSPQRPSEAASITIDQSQIDWDDLDTYQGIPAGFTEAGYPYLGDPNAPVTFEEYSDFLCPFCARHFSQTLPSLLEQYVQTGQVQYVFRDMPLAELHPTAPQGHVAAHCVAEQGPALFWLVHDELFKRQQEWSRLPDPTDYLTGLAEAIGVDMAAYNACLASGRPDSQVQESIAAGQALGFNGTPSFQFIQPDSDETYTLVGALPTETFSQWLDALVAGEAPPEAEEPEPAELPFWANAEGLAPDPDRPGYTLAGDQYKGNPEAKLVVVEFSDFQCPACQRHALETQPTLDEQFIENGHIMWVYKHLPLREHDYAPAAAVAAECAADQGRFWEMHDLLFEQLDGWSTADDSDAALLTLADQLDLDLDTFATCFHSRQALERVLSDLYDAQGVVQTTPNFILLYGGRGRVIRGSRPVDDFIDILRSELEEANASE